MPTYTVLNNSAQKKYFWFYMGNMGKYIFKSFFQRKIVFIILLLLFSFLFAPALRALDKPSNAENYFMEKGIDTAYQFMNKGEYLVSTFSGAIAGSTICGLWCAVGGGAAGAIDELLVYFGFTNMRHLTFGVFGIATGNVINPSSYMPKIGGLAIGILLPSGILNTHPELVMPAISIVAGDPAGTVCNIINELAIHMGITDRHYMAFFMIGNKAATGLLSNASPLVSSFSRTLLGLILSNYEESILASIKFPIKTVEDLYGCYSKFIPKETLDDDLQKQALALIGAQLMIQAITLKRDVHVQNLIFNFERLNIPNNLEAWQGFSSGFYNIAIFVFPFFLTHAASNSINSYFSKKLQHSVEDKVRAELFSDKTASRLPNDLNTRVLTDNLKGDLYETVKLASDLYTEGVSTATNGAYGIAMLMVTAPDIVFYSFICNQIYTIPSNYLAPQESYFQGKIKAINSEISDIMKYDAANVRTIAERDGLSAEKVRLQQLYDASRKYENSQELYAGLNNLFNKVSVGIIFITNYYLVASGIKEGALSFSNRQKFLRAADQAASLFSWSKSNSQKIASINQSLARVNALEKKMHMQPNHIDKINRMHKEGDQLIIENLEMGLGDNILVSIKDLILEMGKTYVLDGAPGCGKSILLSKIKGVETKDIIGKGNIYYPLVNGKTPNILMVSQMDYFPVNSSLQEIITWPNKPPSDPVLDKKQKEEIHSLLKEIRLWDSDIVNEAIDLDDINSGSSFLSGGQKKKIMIVSAIIKKPDILLLDETFAGLGPEATIIVQEMLKKYLPPHALILVVDHQPQTNNYSHFYYKKLMFANKSISLQDVL